MNTPGFTAEASLSKLSEHDHMVEVQQQTDAMILPASNGQAPLGWRKDFFCRFFWSECMCDCAPYGPGENFRKCSSDCDESFTRCEA